MKKTLFAVFALILLVVAHASAATNQYRISSVVEKGAKFPAEFQFGVSLPWGEVYGPFFVSTPNVGYLMSFFGVKTPEEMIGKSFGDENNINENDFGKGNFNKTFAIEATLRKIIARERQGGNYTAPTENDILSETALQLATLQCPKFDSYYPEDARSFLDKVLAFHTKDNKWYYDEAEHKLATDKLVEKVKTVSEDRVEVKEVTEEYATSKYFALRCPARYFVVTRKATSEKLNVALCQDDFVCLK